MAVSTHSFQFRDAHGISIHVRAWLPQQPLRVRAAVQVSHGVGEHSGRYRRFAEHLAACGFAVYADDHRGHGETGRAQWAGDLRRLGRLGPGGLRATEDAVEQLTGIIRERHPGARVGLFAHSWGSLMAQRMLGRSPELWDAVVLSATAYRTPRFLESGPLNRRWRAPGATGFEWLSSDARVGREFLADELTFAANIPRLFGLRDAARLYGIPRPGLSPAVPILLVSGADDPLSRSDGLTRLQTALRRAGARDVHRRVWPGSRHELLNEAVRDEVTEMLSTWFAEHLTAQSLAHD